MQWKLVADHRPISTHQPIDEFAVMRSELRADSAAIVDVYGPPPASTGNPPAWTPSTHAHYENATEEMSASDALNELLGAAPSDWLSRLVASLDQPASPLPTHVQPPALQEQKRRCCRCRCHWGPRERIRKQRGGECFLSCRNGNLRDFEVCYQNHHLLNQTGGCRCGSISTKC